ncbi:hypothetical protein ACFE04_019738 [Oxalis oulophora]
MNNFKPSFQECAKTIFREVGYRRKMTRCNQKVLGKIEPKRPIPYLHLSSSLAIACRTNSCIRERTPAARLVPASRSIDQAAKEEPHSPVAIDLVDPPGGGGSWDRNSYLTEGIQTCYKIKERLQRQLIHPKQGGTTSSIPSISRSSWRQQWNKNLPCLLVLQQDFAEFPLGGFQMNRRLVPLDRKRPRVILFFRSLEERGLVSDKCSFVGHNSSLEPIFHHMNESSSAYRWLAIWNNLSKQPLPSLLYWSSSWTCFVDWTSQERNAYLSA